MSSIDTDVLRYSAKQEQSGGKIDRTVVGGYCAGSGDCSEMDMSPQLRYSEDYLNVLQQRKVVRGTIVAPDRLEF